MITRESGERREERWRGGGKKRVEERTREEKEERVKRGRKRREDLDRRDSLFFS